MLVVLPHAMTVEIRKRTSAQVFSSNFFEIFHGSLFFSTPPSECSRSKSDHLKFLKQIIIFICTSAKSIISRLAVLCPAIIIDNGITKMIAYNIQLNYRIAVFKNLWLQWSVKENG